MRGTTSPPTVRWNKVLIPECKTNWMSNLKAVDSIRKVKPDAKVPLISARKRWYPKSLTIDIAIDTLKGKKTIKGELDCDCHSTIIDPRVIKKYGFKKWKAPVTRKVLNADGTVNKNGKITHFIREHLTIDNVRQRMEIPIMHCGDADIMLGLDWFVAYNPQIDWRKGTLTIP